MALPHTPGDHAYPTTAGAFHARLQSALLRVVQADPSHAEMNVTGFNTDRPFSPGLLARYAERGKIFLLTSTDSGTRYLAVCILSAGDGWRAGIQLYFPEKKQGGFDVKLLHQVTFTQTTSGLIHVTPGWR